MKSRMQTLYIDLNEATTNGDEEKVIKITKEIEKEREREDLKAEAFYSSRPWWHGL